MIIKRKKKNVPDLTIYRYLVLPNEDGWMDGWMKHDERTRARKCQRDV